jgi:hypothetical protein
MSEAVVAAVAYLSEGEVVLTAAEAAAVLTAVEFVAAVAYTAYAGAAARREQRQAQQGQIDQYNASLRDRYVMSRGATEPRTLVLGRQRVSGPIFFIQSYGTNREHLVFCVPLAGHEIDAIEAIYFDDEQVILDGSGNVTGVNRRELFSISAAGGAFTLATTPKSGSVSAVVRYGSTSVTLGVSVAGLVVTVSGATAGQTGVVTISYQPDPCPFVPVVLVQEVGNITTDGAGNATVALAHAPYGSNWTIVQPGGTDGADGDVSSFGSVAGLTLTFTGGPASTALVINYQYNSVVSRAKVTKYLGAPGQTADAAMITALPGVWTAAHTATGVAYLKVELDYDPDAFPGGLPNISATVRGAKVFDPRSGVTAWSENPALLLRHTALHALCGRLAAGTVNDVACAVAANVCDTATAYVVNGQTYNRARYTAGTVVRSGTRGQDVLNDLAQAMGGKWAFIEGQLKMLAGAYVTPLQTLDETWLSGTAPVQVQPRANRADVFNSITAKFADESSDYQVLDVPRVASTTYITEDGAELPLTLQMNAVTFSGQAQQLGAQQLRYARAGMRMTLACNHRADAVEWGDNLFVNLSRFGLAGQVMEVLETGYTIDGGIALTLKFCDPTIWDIGSSFATNALAPNTFLPSPFVIPDVTGLTVDSSNAVQTRNSDGTVQQRMRVSWAAIANQAVLASGGGVEVRYGLTSQPEAQWVSVIGEGASTQVDISGVKPGQIYLVKARAFNALVNGRWSNVVKHTLGVRSIAIDTPQIMAGAVGTAQMATNSATEVIYAVDVLCSSPSTMAYTTFTPSANCTATVVVEVDEFFDNTAGGSTLKISAKTSTGIGIVSGGSAPTPLGSNSGTWIIEPIAAGENIRRTITVSAAYSLVAGATYAAYATFGNHTSSTISGTVANARLKLELIKR